MSTCLFTLDICEGLQTGPVYGSVGHCVNNSKTGCWEVGYLERICSTVSLMIGLLA